jgi:NAD(P)-dependent dehydrogenase (short-subunit alcohol dehydrogenase family)
MVEAAIAVLGGLEVLVNNAGISGSTTPVEKSNPDDWEKVVQVNLIGTFNVTRLGIPI